MIGGIISTSIAVLALASLLSKFSIPSVEDRSVFLKRYVLVLLTMFVLGVYIMILVYDSHQTAIYNQNLSILEKQTKILQHLISQQQSL